jgi:hypothetical protein
MPGGVGGAVSDGRPYPDRHLLAISFYRGPRLFTYNQGEICDYFSKYFT